MPFLGEIPLFTQIRIGGDQGVPIVVSNPVDKASEPFFQVAKTLRDLWK